MRTRLLDFAVATVCVACVCAPLLPTGIAATATDSAVVESGGTVDQRVLQSGIISNPLNGTFEAGGTGTVDGAVSWDVYTTSRDGLKLVLATDREPAMRDSSGGEEVADYTATPSAWSVSGSDRRFGFTVLGSIGLSRFSDGAKWRGLEGRRAVEVARKSSTIPKTRTTIKLRAEFGSSLGSGARPSATLYATAVPNL